MSTLDQIQVLVDDACGKISQGVFVDQLQKNGWREIRRAINNYPDLDSYGRSQLATLIHGRLDAFGLQAGKKIVGIDVKDLTRRIQEHSAGPGSKENIPEWFPW